MIKKQKKKSAKVIVQANITFLNVIVRFQSKRKFKVNRYTL